MHELGVVNQIVKTVDRIAAEHGIRRITHITLEVGELSGFVPLYLKKLFPIAVDMAPLLKQAELQISMIPGKGLSIKEIGY